MYKKSILFLNTIFLTTLVTGCSTTRQLPEDDPYFGSEGKLIIVKENSQEELLIDCTDYLENQSDDISSRLAYFIQNHVFEFTPDGRQIETKYKITCGSENIEISHDKTYGQSKNKKLVFIFHGGRVGRKAGMKEALESLLYMSEDNHYWDEHHPVFINWRTGDIDSYREQTLYIRNGIREPIFGPVTAPYNFLSDLGSGIADLFTTATLEGNRLYKSIDQEEFNQCISKTFLPTIICPTKEALIQEYPKGSIGLTYALATPVRAGTSPILNGLGRSSWENMVRRTRNLIWREKEGSDCDNDCLEKGGLVELFDKLECSEHEISMIGHSMGTMLITDIIHHYPQLNYTDIVFMGAAVSIREFQNTMKTLLAVSKNQTSAAKQENLLHFYNLSLLPIAEAREFTARGLLPSGSLLEFIDEMFASTPSRLDKTLGKWSNVREVMNTFPIEAKSYITFKVFGLDDKHPVKHGDFNDPFFRYWEESFWGKPELNQ